MEHDDDMAVRDFSWPAALLPGVALTALLIGSAGAQQTADERPAGRVIVELEVSNR